jgi:hypothetical protein
MEGMVALVLFLAFLFGGMMLALVMGYRDIEERREREAASARKVARGANGVMVTGFFAGAESRAYEVGPGIAFDDALLSRLEQHVLAEHQRVAEFVHYPSMDRLYRESDSMLHVH